MGRPVTFVIDMLNDCFGHAELDRVRPVLCSSINHLTALARANAYPVVWIRQEFEPDLSDAFLDMKREDIRFPKRREIFEASPTGGGSGKHTD